MELTLKPAMINELDLTKELSLKSLAELSDLDAKNICDTAVIDDCISDAVSYIASFIKIPKNPTSLLKDICVKLTIMELKRRNDFPKESLEEIREWANELLLKMANKKIPTEINEEEDFIPQNKIRAFKHTRARMDLRRING
ncbi:phage protein Gp36 family protein [Helicobacter valdiviensis]|nr:phage protein Gp36 family protein [Helicobacter valdiviensis]